MYLYPNRVSLSLFVMAMSVMSCWSARSSRRLSPFLFSLSPLALSFIIIGLSVGYCCCSVLIWLFMLFLLPLLDRV